jgi:hypothetical protein
MAKVKITGHASGTGVVTVTAPNTSTDRTITLPDATATLATTAEAFNPDAAQVFNESGADVDFRVESDTVTHALFVDGATGAVGLGTPASNYNGTADNLVVYDDTNHAGITIANGAANKVGAIYFADGASGTAEYEGYIEYNHNNNSLNFGTNHASRMLIDSTGAVTKPSQPAFSAQLSSPYSLLVSQHQNLPFATEIFDQNADFNTSTYTFTAPITGKYQLNLVTRVDNMASNATYYHLYLFTSNRTYFDIIDPRGFDQDPAYIGLTVAALADMDAGDTATAKFYQSGGTEQSAIASSGDSSFSGFLAC